MKTVIILGDGMSDEPIERLGGKTPLMAAKKPNMDRIAREGQVGLFSTIPKGQPNGSAVANLSVLGYDPATTFQGRAVLEAASMEVPLYPPDVALRLNLIAVEDGKIKNHSAGHISTDEAETLILALDQQLGGGYGDQPLTIHPGVSYRHLLALREEWASPDIICAPPHDHVGETVSSLMPRARTKEAEPTEAKLVELYEQASSILENHPVNAARKARGEDMANAIWPWSPGRRPTMKTFQDRFGIKGAVISAVDLVKGLGYYAGMTVLNVPGATGLWDTNYESKALNCVNALEHHGLVYVHVEATDEAGHAQDLDLKIKCIEMLDKRLIGPILNFIDERQIEVSVAVLPDHPTPVETGKHSSDPVPVAIRRPGLSPDSVQFYDEEQAATGDLGHMQGEDFIRQALGIQ